MGDSEAAERLASFLDGQFLAWERHLKTFGNAHWHIISLVRSHGEHGVSVRLIFAHLAGVFGMDMSTCVKRLRELIQRELLTGDSEPITRATLILPTPLLTRHYDAYCVELANVALSIADNAERPIVNGPGSAALSDTLHRFFMRFAEQSQPEMERYIRRTVPQPARRERASRCIPTFGYWQSTFICWKARAAGRAYIFADDLHVALYAILMKSPDATRQIVTDLIDWGFLVRRSRADGVPNNRFAVSISEDAFELYRAIFRDGYDLLVSTCREVLRVAEATPQEPGTVVPLKRPSRRGQVEPALRTDSAGAG